MAQNIEQGAAQGITQGIAQGAAQRPGQDTRGIAKGLLGGARVVEVGEGVAVAYCGKTLAQLGADVVKVEPPQGDAARRAGPFPGDAPHREKSGLFLALNANKRGVALDLGASEGAEAFRCLAAGADIVLEDAPSARLDALGLGYNALSQANAALVMASISPFGRQGPYAGYKATDLTLFHMSGQAHGLLGPVESPDDAPPIRAGGNQTGLVAGMAAATAALMALFRARMTGKGARVDASAHGAMATQLISALAGSAFGKPAPPRDISQAREAATGGVVAAVGGVLPCKDGYVAISPREDAQWERWVDLMGNPEWAPEERFITREGRERNFPELWELVSEWTRGRSKHYIARMGQRRRIPCFPVNTVSDLFRDEHLREREFFVETAHPIAGTLRYPGAPYRLSGARLPLAERPAPLLGEHNAMLGEDV